MTTNDEKERKIRDNITDAVRFGLGHAIKIIDDYAAGSPPARPYCADLSYILREHSAHLGAPSEENISERTEN